jgi:hypothetical protein
VLRLLDLPSRSSCTAFRRRNADRPSGAFEISKAALLRWAEASSAEELALYDPR